MTARRIHHPLASFILALILTSLLFLGTAVSLRKLISLEDARTKSLSSDTMQSRESLYLPSVQAVEIASLGFRNVFAHILWFNTINYFGKQFRGERNYLWLAHMCDLVTTLNPRKDYALRFCATLLAWEGGQPERSIAILDRAVTTFPEDWIFFYLRGFTKIFFLADDEGGNADMIHAASLPGAHFIVKSLAAKKLSAQQSPEAAIRFLSDAIKLTEDPAAKRALEDKLKDSLLEYELQTLEGAIVKFRGSKGRLPASLDEIAAEGLATEALVERRFHDPHGGIYQLDAQSGVVSSTSGKPRMTAKWKRSSNISELPEVPHD
jgi:hypothetical protein